MLTIARPALLLALLCGGPSAAPDPAPPGGARLVPTLDKAKGDRAVAAYVAAVTKHCTSRDAKAAVAPRAWEDVGLGSDADVATLCDAGPTATALASGALLRPGADEVLLLVPSGQARALGEQLLVVMQANGQAFRFEQAGVLGNGFEARARVSVPGGRDIVLLCDRRGQGGLYPTLCGFLGQGSFGEPLSATGDKIGGEAELHLGWTTECGPATSLSLGPIALRDGQLAVQVLLEDAVLKAANNEEPQEECTKRTIKSKKTFSLSYALGSNGAHLATPIPEKMRKSAEKFDY